MVVENGPALPEGPAKAPGYAVLGAAPSSPPLLQPRSAIKPLAQRTAGLERRADGAR